MLRYNLTIIQGESFSQDVSFRTSTNPYSLTGYTAKSQIRPYVGSPELIAEFDCTVYPTEGYIHMELSSEKTAAIPAGTYQYDLLLYKNGVNNYYIGGKVFIEKYITEPIVNEQ